MALATWTCTKCEKVFKVGNWACAGGENHVVASKRYYMNDAPTVVTMVNGVATVNKRDSRTQIQNIPPERRVPGPDGQERIVPGGQVEFIRGVFETNDPEQQFWLDQHRGMCSEKEWQAAYLNEDEKMALREMDLAAREQRLEADRNSLLEQVQKRA